MSILFTLLYLFLTLYVLLRWLYVSSENIHSASQAIVTAERSYHAFLRAYNRGVAKALIVTLTRNAIIFIPLIAFSRLVELVLL